jgi:hypothetical protein
MAGDVGVFFAVAGGEIGVLPDCAAGGDGVRVQSGQFVAEHCTVIAAAIRASRPAAPSVIRRFIRRFFMANLACWGVIFWDFGIFLARGGWVAAWVAACGDCLQ